MQTHGIVEGMKPEDEKRHQTRFKRWLLAGGAMALVMGLAAAWVLLQERLLLFDIWTATAPALAFSAGPGDRGGGLRPLPELDREAHGPTRTAQFALG